MQEEKEGTAKPLLLFAWQPTQNKEHALRLSLGAYSSDASDEHAVQLYCKDVDLKSSDSLQESILKPLS